AVQDVHHPRLAAMHEDLARTALIRDVRQHRTRRSVVVPQIVMDFLEVPFPLSRFQIERDERRGEQVIAPTLGSIRGGRRVAGGAVPQPELRIDRGMRPDGRAALFPRIAFPRLMAELAGAGHRPELPYFLPGLGVVGAELSAHTELAAAD